VVTEPLKCEEMFDRLDKSNDSRTWLLRFVGWLAIYLGIYLLFSPLIAAVSWIPLVGFLFAHGVSFIAGILAFVLSVLFAGLTISIAWLVYRPLMGLLFIILIGSVTGFALVGTSI
jgi:uncharacterized membrane protein HdeD (DUF308 family)